MGFKKVIDDEHFHFVTPGVLQVFSTPLWLEATKDSKFQEYLSYGSKDAKELKNMEHQLSVINSLTGKALMFATE